MCCRSIFVLGLRVIGSPKQCLDTHIAVALKHGAYYCYLISKAQYDYCKADPSLDKKVCKIKLEVETVLEEERNAKRYLRILAMDIGYDRNAGVMLERLLPEAAKLLSTDDLLTPLFRTTVQKAHNEMLCKVPGVRVMVVDSEDSAEMVVEVNVPKARAKVASPSGIVSSSIANQAELMSIMVPTDGFQAMLTFKVKCPSEACQLEFHSIIPWSKYTRKL